MCVSICVETRGLSQPQMSFPGCCLPYFLNRVFYFDMELTNSARLTDLQTQESNLSQSPQGMDYKSTLPLQAFNTCVLGTELGPCACSLNTLLTEPSL